MRSCNFFLWKIYLCVHATIIVNRVSCLEKASSSVCREEEQVRIFTAGCTPSDRINEFFTLSKLKYIGDSSDSSVIGEWDAAWLCNMLNKTIASSGIDFSKLKEGQTVNTFPKNVRRLTNNKANLCRAIHFSFPESRGFRFHLPCFVLPEHGKLIGTYLTRSNDTYWLHKPEVGSGGKDISLLHLADLTKLIDQRIPSSSNVYIQQYLHDTLLLQYFSRKRGASIPVKFDARVYFAITSLHPLRVWVHNKGFVRLATKEFSLENEAKYDKRRHIANLHYQTQFLEYEYPDPLRDVCNTSCRTLKCAVDQISKTTGKESQHIWDSLFQILGKTGAAISTTLKSSIKCHGCYQIWGADVVFDSRGKPYLIEVNTSPSIEKNKKLPFADGFALQNVYKDLWAMKGVDFSTRHLLEDYSCTIEDFLPLLDPTRFHQNGILKKLFLHENVDMKLKVDALFHTVMKMLLEFKHRGGFHLGWPRPSIVRHRLELGRLPVPHETIDGSHLMTYLEAQTYEIFFEAALHVEEIQRICYNGKVN
eukprot:g8674.t1